MRTEKRYGNPLAYLFQKMWHYSAGNRKVVVLFWLVFVVANGINLFGEPLLWAKMMNVIQEEGINDQNLFSLLALLASIFLLDIVFWGFHGPARILENLNAFKGKANYQKHLLKGVMTLPLEWHTDHHSGDTIDKVLKGTRALDDFSEKSFEIIYSVGHLVGSYIMLSYFCPPAAIIVVVMFLLIALIVMRFDRVMMGQYIELNRAENRIAESIFDAISNITTVTILRVEKLVFGSLVHKIDKPYQLYKKNTITNEIKWSITSLFCSLTTVLVIGAYLWQHLGAEQGVLVSSLYLLIRYMDRISEQAFEFTGRYSSIVKQQSQIYNSEELTEDFREESFTNHVLPKDWQRLDIKNLRFSYHGENGFSAHLDDISLSLLRGEKIAFVGKSGSGKTTLLKVIRDLYHPQRLTLLVDGKVVPHGFEGISRAIALIPQNPEIFATTIEGNITLGAEHTEEEIRRVTNWACITEVIDALPHGFASSVKEKGVNLSGGQQQRVALARGLLACVDKEIILLDEPTSSLDTANERTVYQNIFREFAGRTIVSSIHRLHLLPLFDRIYFFDEGRIVGHGTLAELLANCPDFQALWRQYQNSSASE